VSTIDRAALIEQAAKSGWEALMGQGHEADFHSFNRGWFVAWTEAGLPVIAKALLAPLRELHHDHVCGDVESEHWCHISSLLGRCVKVGTCSHCGIPRPCPTVRLLDAIEAEVSA